MKLAVLAVAAALVAVPTAEAGIPGTPHVKVCGEAGPYWPTMTLALSGDTAWVACKEGARVLRVDLAGKKPTATVRLDGPVIAVAVGLGAVWALDSSSVLYRVNARTARVTKRIAVDAAAPYNIWTGGGSLWVADDQGGAVLRISPSVGKVVARIAVSDGPADMVFSGQRAWVIDHRDNTLFGVDLTTNAATRLASVGGDNAAAERIALLGESLWVTGRGLPLVEVDPQSGTTRRSIDIQGTGIDIVAAAGALWIPVRTAAVDSTGFPTMIAVRRVTPAGAVSTIARARGRVDVHGFAAGRGAIWLADNTNGFVYRLPS